MLIASPVPDTGTPPVTVTFFVAVEEPNVFRAANVTA
jgi:hypothetical protein